MVVRREKWTQSTVHETRGKDLLIASLAFALGEMILETDISSSEKSGVLSFRQLSNGSEIYRITLRFPVDDYRREAVH